MVEAGCWNGGSTAKFSLVCRLLGYRLHVYDSFEGVEAITAEEGESAYDFTGEYAAAEEAVHANVRRFGALEVCETHRGWFADTLAVTPPPGPVRVAYIDCDLAKGTREALEGVVPRLTEDGWVFTQDFHIAPVRELLQDAGTWARLEQSPPTIEPMCHHLAALRHSLTHVGVAQFSGCLNPGLLGHWTVGNQRILIGRERPEARDRLGQIEEGIAGRRDVGCGRQDHRDTTDFLQGSTVPFDLFL